MNGLSTNDLYKLGALENAVKSFSPGAMAATEEILTRAQAFLGFLSNDVAAPATPTKPTPAATKPKDVPTKPVATKPKVESKPEPEGPSEEAVGMAIKRLLSSNKMKEAAALLAEFGATNKSSLAPEHYAAFITGADAILLAD